MKAVCVIPCRMESTRLPGKVMLDVHGEPLYARTVEAALRCPAFGLVAVATDSRELGMDALLRLHPRGGVDVSVFGGDFACGTDRVAHYVRGMVSDPPEIVVNLQADEPEVSAIALEALVDAIEKGAEMATLVSSRNPTDEELDSLDCVQMLPEQRPEGLWAINFTRQPKRFRWHGFNHIGAYAFTRDALLRFADHGPTPLEAVEHLEQMRIFEMNPFPWMAAIPVEHHGRGINTRSDYEALLDRWQSTNGSI